MLKFQNQAHIGVFEFFLTSGIRKEPKRNMITVRGTNKIHVHAVDRGCV